MDEAIAGFETSDMNRIEFFRCYSRNFVTTDTAISSEMVQKALSEIVKITYNCLSIDGDTSTNDMVSVMANGLAGNKEIVAEDENYEKFKKALYIVMSNMTKMLAADGEGASKLLECTCCGAPDMETAIDAVNEIASEHLEIVTKNPFDTMTRVKNAGAIFLGEYSSEPLGDYFAGPNHVLPTNGTAKFFSALSVDDFIKKSSIISYSREALQDVYKDIVQFAECEQLTAHANSIKVRFEEV